MDKAFPQELCPAPFTHSNPSRSHHDLTRGCSPYLFRWRNRGRARCAHLPEVTQLSGRARRC